MTAPPEDRRPADDDDYSATALASHWIQRPDPDTTAVDLTPLDPTAVDPTAAGLPDDTAVTAPADGTVLRFGPGVTAALAHRPPPTLPTVTPPPAPPRRRRLLRRHALPALVVTAVVAYTYWWEHDTAPVSVREVSVTAARPSLGCGMTAEIVGVVRTDGRPGTLSYRWVRNDGTASDVRHATLERGRGEARFRLSWTFQGQGRRTAEAELRLLSPVERSAAVTFTYACP
ncbi:hypothetical protein [Streptomyces sp. NPDC002328]|uniref:hypothetical protein n=1 Tax=Streptomyces sp. NPDC002328 TaxID=3364642 RepID=UPI00368B8A50